MPAGGDAVTTEPAVMTASLPMVTPGATKTWAPTHAPSSTVMGRLRNGMCRWR